MVHSAAFYKLYQTTYEKYAELYGSQVCVFLLKGSFYELYGIYDPVQDRHLNPVKEVADLLDLQLKVYPNDVDQTKTGLFGGVPDHTIHKWAGKLCSQGWTCVLIDQIKDSGGQVTARKVARVLSPGTHIEQVSSDESMYVASIYIQATSTIHPPQIGICAIEATTGEILHYEASATGHASSWHADLIAQFNATFQPKECIIAWNGSGLHMPDEQALRILFDIPQLVPVHLKVLDQDSLEDSTAQAQYLQELFQPESLMSVLPWAGLQDSPTATASLCRLFAYLENHDPALIQRLACPVRWNPSQHLRVLNHAMEQLNIRQATGQTVEWLFNRCLTSLGKRKFKERLQTPWSSPQQIQQMHAAVEWVLQQSKETRRGFEACLRSIVDISRHHRQMARGSLSHASAQQVVQTMDAMLLLLEELKESTLFDAKVKTATEHCRSVFESCFHIPTVLKYMADSQDVCINWLNPDKCPATTKAFQNLEACRQNAATWKEAFETKTGATISFRSGDASRYLVTIPKSVYKTIKAKDFPTCTFSQLSSGVKIQDPALDKLSDATLAAEAKFNACFQEELALLCADYVSKTHTVWRDLESWIATTDCSITHATVAEQYRLVKPTIVNDDTSHVAIENLRHILIETQKTTAKYTTHTVNLGEDTNGMLLYGINASGKSSLMKAIGIAVVLAQAGLYVPATSMKLSPFQTLATRILNHDNIAQGMSSFTVEMSELREILRVADSRCLVLGDEVCAGTENVSGTAIVASSLLHLLQNQTRFVFATHLHDLLKVPSLIQTPTLKIFHLKVEYDPVSDMLLYHRTLLPGSGTTYYGLEVAKALHLPQSVLDSAYAIRTRLMGEVPIEEATGSNWNSHKLRKSCELCGNELKSTLQIHHIQERAQAVNRTANQDGTGLHDLRNLITVCEECHHKHHAGETTIEPVLQTSKGLRRPSNNKGSELKEPSGLDPAIQRAVVELAAENPGCAINLLALKLKVKKQIQLKPAELKKILTAERANCGR